MVSFTNKKTGVFTARKMPYNFDLFAIKFKSLIDHLADSHAARLTCDYKNERERNPFLRAHY